MILPCRSEQTKEQIRVTSIQNNFANYYKHLEEFIKYVDKHQYTDNISGARYIHKRLYPDAQSGKYDLCKNLLTTWELVNNIPRELLNTYPSDYDESVRDEDLDTYIDKVIKLSSYLREGEYHPRDKYKKGTVLINGRTLPVLNQIKNNGCPHENTYLSQSIELMSSIKDVTDTLDKICNFSVEHTSRLNEELNRKFIKSNYKVGNNKYSQLKHSQTFNESNERFKKLLEQLDNHDHAA